MVRTYILFFAIFLSGVFLVNTTFAASYALLVGVSGYPSLTEEKRLRGPANDVQLMRQVLIKSGISTRNITILADGVSFSKALPTRANILAELDLLALHAEPEDWIIIYLSGHGSQQPQFYSGRGYQEPDGLDEIFLPYDVATWNGTIGKVAGAVLDDEFGEKFDAINQRGAHVWAIFDTCHAGGMSKASVQIGAESEESPRWRYVKPTDLGVPFELMQRARKKNAEKYAKSSRIPRVKNETSLGTLVVFYSSQKNEPSAEESLPDILFNSGTSTQKNLRFGVFTWYLAQSLPKWKDSYRALTGMIDENYRNVRPFPTPSFEGALQINPHSTQAKHLPSK